MRCLSELLEKYVPILSLVQFQYQLKSISPSTLRPPMKLTEKPEIQGHASDAGAHDLRRLVNADESGEEDSRYPSCRRMATNLSGPRSSYTFCMSTLEDG